MIRLDGVGHIYAPRTPWAHRALTGIDLAVQPGERVLVTGPNGSGKSTLAWILAGLILPTEGVAAIDGRALSDAIGTVTIAFQHARLQLFRPTVEDDIRFGARLDDDQIDAALDVVGLDPGRFRPRRVDSLSGGEQRRVVLAGLLARRPRLMVLDEPLAGLDSGARQSLVDVLAHLRREGGLATVIVSHDLDDAAVLADRVVALEVGRVVSDGPLVPSGLAGP